MKIALDATYAGQSSSQKGGVYQYIFHLVQALSEVDKENEYLLFFSFFRNKHRQTTDEFYSLFKKAGYGRKDCRIPSLIWKRLQFPIELFTGKIDLFHGLFDYVPRMLSGKSIVTIHDLAYLRRPEFLGSKRVKWKQKETPRSAKQAEAIITISNFSKNDLVNFLGISQEKIFVIPHGVSPDFVPTKEKRILAKYKIKRNYILFVGVLQPSKNIVRLIEAFYELKQSEHIGHQLVIVGQKGWLYDEIYKRCLELRLENDIIFTGEIPHNELPGLYSGADVFVLPSQFESFGIPVLEAMACGTPVVTSNTCALPETAGDAAILVKPDSVHEIAGGIYQVLSDNNLQASLRQKGFAHAKKFTWENTAKMTLEVYRKGIL
ncbi:MAG: glycosyltransferase family 1 protein [bacterium]